jgi:hypothetical protein
MAAGQISMNRFSRELWRSGSRSRHRAGYVKRGIVNDHTNSVKFTNFNNTKNRETW